MQKCSHCHKSKSEPLVQACSCGPEQVYHMTCLRNKIIATADQKCVHCYQHYRHRLIRRIHPFKTVRDVIRRLIYYTLIFGVFWLLTRQINLVIGDYMMAIERTEQSESSSRTKCPYKDKDLCSECQYMFFGTVKGNDVDLFDLWMPMSYEWGVAIILTAISVIYFRKKFRRDIIQDASTRIVLLDGYRQQFGQWVPKLRLFINRDEVLVKEWDPSRGKF